MGELLLLRLDLPSIPALKTYDEWGGGGGGGGGGG